MVDAQRMLPGSDIVAQCQVKLKDFPDLSCNRRDRIVRLSVRLRKDKCRFVRVAAPFVQYMVCQCDEPLFVLTSDAEHGQRPLYDAGLHILVTWNGHFFLNRRLRHSEGVMPSLEVIVA